jgi:hypothetical protein
MSAQPFEIRCPSCGSVVPPEAKGCTCVTAASKKRGPVVEASAAAATPSAPAAPGPATVVDAPDVVNMRLNDYHRLVRSNYIAVEGPRVGARPGGSHVRAYLPFVLLVLGLLIGAGMVFGKF